MVEYAIVGGALSGFALSKASTLMSWAQRRATFSILCTGQIYDAIAWKLGSREEEPCLIVGSSNEVDASGQTATKTKLNTRLGSGTRVLKVGGKNAVVSSSRQVTTLGNVIEDLTITAARKSKRPILEWIASTIQEFEKSKVEGLRVWSWDGYWQCVTTRPFRSITSIQHPDCVPSRMVALCEDWQTMEQEYAERGENWQISFLLHGKPGTGKTSMAIALASHLKKELYVIAPDNTSTFERALATVKPGSLVLFDECEQVFAHRKDSAKDEAKKIASRLSSIDGATSVHNLIRVYTTNHIEELDHAFRREGRCDYEFEFFGKGLALESAEAIA